MLSSFTPTLIPGEDIYLCLLFVSTCIYHNHMHTITPHVILTHEKGRARTKEGWWPGNWTLHGRTLREDTRKWAPMKVSEYEQLYDMYLTRPSTNSCTTHINESVQVRTVVPHNLTQFCTLHICNSIQYVHICTYCILLTMKTGFCKLQTAYHPLHKCMYFTLGFLHTELCTLNTAHCACSFLHTDTQFSSEESVCVHVHYVSMSVYLNTAHCVHFYTRTQLSSEESVCVRVHCRVNCMRIPSECPRPGSHTLLG